VIGRNADVRCSLLDHLQQGLQHADNRAEGLVLAFVEAAQAVEVPEQLVGPVYNVNDHASLCRGSVRVAAMLFVLPGYGTGSAFVKLAFAMALSVKVSVPLAFTSLR